MKKTANKRFSSGGEGSRTLDKELMSLLLWPLSYPASTDFMILLFQETVNKYDELFKQTHD